MSLCDRKIRKENIRKEPTEGKLHKEALKFSLEIRREISPNKEGVHPQKNKEGVLSVIPHAF